MKVGEAGTARHDRPLAGFRQMMVTSGRHRTCFRRIGQHDVVGALGVSPIHPSRAERQQSIDLGLTIRRVKVEMMALIGD